MKAKLVDSMPSRDWIYEIKFDGYRALALRGGGETRILSRNQKDLGSKFTEVVDSITALDLQDSYLKDSTWDRSGHQSPSRHLICSGLTARTFKFYQSKRERRSWKNC
jgi:hypothetical protein